MAARKKFVFFVILFSVCCANLLLAGGKQPRQRPEAVIFPPPPDTTRIQFLTRISTSADVTGRRSGFLRYIMGEEKERPIIKPYGLAAFRGKIYICDTILGGLEIIDLKSKTFEYFTPEGRGKLRKPINCAVDDRGDLYVADSERRQVVVFDSNGNYHSSFGNPDSLKPTDVFITPGTVWVCDILAKKIRAYDQNSYRPLMSFPHAAAGESGYLFSPTNLYVRNDRIYVSDFGDFKIKIFNIEGKYLKSIGSYGRNVGQFVRPKGIAVDEEDNLFVADAGFENVQIFNSRGKILMFFGGSYKGPGNMWLPAKVVIDYENTDFFREFVDPAFNLKYLIYVTNQYGPDKISVYGFVEPR
ncbi:MAG: hypothetical protein P8184_05470 [Calditrichia bacterium]